MILTFDGAALKAKDYPIKKGKYAPGTRDD